MIITDPTRYAALASRVERVALPWLTSLADANVREITHLTRHGELETAFEGFMLSATQAALPFSVAERQELYAPCIALELDREVTLFADFWQRASAFLDDKR